jgi:hypothetical protein
MILNINVFYMHLNDHFFIKTSVESCLQSRFQINETLDFFSPLSQKNLKMCLYAFNFYKFTYNKRYISNF